MDDVRWTIRSVSGFGTYNNVIPCGNFVIVAASVVIKSFSEWIVLDQMGDDNLCSQFVFYCVLFLS